MKHLGFYFLQMLLEITVLVYELFLTDIIFDLR